MGKKFCLIVLSSYSPSCPPLPTPYSLLPTNLKHISRVGRLNFACGTRTRKDTHSERNNQYSTGCRYHSDGQVSTNVDDCIKFYRHLHKLIMRCPKAFVGAQGIAPLNHFWRCPIDIIVKPGRKPSTARINASSNNTPSR